MNVRAATVGDTDAIYSISQRSFSVSWSLEAIQGDLKSENAIYFVVEEEERVVGFIGMRKIFDEGEITNVAVDEVARGRGTGIILVRKLLDHCRENDIVNVLLEVRESNLPAHKTYEKNGFKVISRRKGYYQHPKEDALIMQWCQ